MTAAKPKTWALLLGVIWWKERNQKDILPCDLHMYSIVNMHSLTKTHIHPHNLYSNDPQIWFVDRGLLKSWNQVINTIWCVILCAPVETGKEMKGKSQDWVKKIQIRITQKSQAWGHTPWIPAFGRQSQVDLCTLEVSMLYKVSSRRAGATWTGSTLEQKQRNTLKKHEVGVGQNERNVFF